MVNHAALACVTEFLCRLDLTQHRREEMFYQLALLQFGDYSRLRLDPPPSLRRLVKIAVEVEEGTERSGMSKDEIVDVCSSKFPYFSRSTQRPFTANSQDPDGQARDAARVFLF